MKIVKRFQPLLIFAKATSLMFDWDFNAPVRTYNFPTPSCKFVFSMIKRHDQLLHGHHDFACNSFQVKAKCKSSLIINFVLCTKNDEKYFSFHLKSSRFSKYLNYVMTFWSCRKNGLISPISHELMTTKKWNLVS